MVADDVGDEGGEVVDGDVFAGADVDGAGLGGVLEEVEGGVGEVVGVEEFAFDGAGAPDGDGRGVGFFGFVDLAEECGEDVAGVEVVVVAGAVEVGGHGADVVVVVLAAVAVAEFDGGDLGDGVGAVGGFEGAGEEGVFGDGLGGVFGVDAGAAEVEELGARRCGGRRGGRCRRW